MSSALLRWLRGGEDGNGSQEAVSSHVRAGATSGLPTFESLEPRLLLSNGLFGPQQVISTDAPGAQSVYAADLDGDGDVDRDDLSVFLGAFGTAEPGASDMDDDGDCDRDDLAIFLGVFGNEPAPYAGGQADEAVLLQQANGSLDTIYAEFNQFCIDNFGAENEPLVYETFGSELEFLADGFWEYSSVESACIAFETNLPAWTYVDFGETDAYGQRTAEAERPFYIHVHYLTGLKRRTTYHYRLVGMDERGNILTSDDRTFTTGSLVGWNIIDGSLPAPYVLDTAGSYLVTEDLVIDGLGFDITSANVTLDLGGHTVIYDNVHMGDIPGTWEDYFEQSAIGVRTYYKSNIRVLNGTIRQGAGQDKGSDSQGLGFNPIFLRGGSTSGEIAGITAEYGGPQLSGIVPLYCRNVEVHHNVIKDEGTVITNRSQMLAGLGAGYDAHHNLIKRARQSGVKAQNDSEIRDNEIYVDSYATNSYGIMAYRTVNSLLSGNRIFGTGYNYLGIGTISTGIRNIRVHSNFIQAQATAPTSRWPEYGDISDTYCVRISYSSGADNIDYYNNVLVAKARDGGRARGVWFQGDDDVTNVVFRKNTVKCIYETPGVAHLGSQLNWRGGAIVLCGDGDNADDAPMVFRDNTIMSNYRNIAFADGWYGTISNTQFYDNHIVKVGARSDYFTIDSGSWYKDSVNNLLVDSTFEGGASYDSVQWIGTGTRNFIVGWTLAVHTEPYADVTVRDLGGSEVFSGQATSHGKVSVVLVQYLQEPAGRTYSTPHTVTAELNGNSNSTTVTMDQPREIDLYITPLVGDFNGDGVVDRDDLAIFLGAFETPEPGAPDLDGDGDCDRDDLAIFLGAFGSGIPLSGASGPVQEASPVEETEAVEQSAPDVEPFTLTVAAADDSGEDVGPPEPTDPEEPVQAALPVAKEPGQTANETLSQTDRSDHRTTSTAATQRVIPKRASASPAPHDVSPGGPDSKLAAMADLLGREVENDAPFEAIMDAFLRGVDHWYEKNKLTPEQHDELIFYAELIKLDLLD